MKATLQKLDSLVYQVFRNRIKINPVNPVNPVKKYNNVNTIRVASVLLLIHS